MFNPPNPQPFNRLVWKIVHQIPAGRVSTYGQIASMIPPPEGVDPEKYQRLSPRWVGTAMRSTPDESIPWQRVINSQGVISLPKGSEGADEQRFLLESEGIEFNERGRVDFNVYGWEGPGEEWLHENGLFPPRSLRKPTQKRLF